MYSNIYGHVPVCMYVCMYVCMHVFAFIYFIDRRLRTALVQAADLSTELQEMKQQMDRSVGSFAVTEEKLQTQIADLNRAIASIKDDDVLMRAKLAIAEKVCYQC